MEIKFDTAYVTVKPIASLICVLLLLLFCIVSGAKAECPFDSAAAYCQNYFPGSVATSSCEYSECFGMSYGDQIRVVPTYEKGLFPQTWFIWGKGELDTSYYAFPCSLNSEGKKKTRVEIPTSHHCGVDFIASDGTVYHELFASSPDSLCVGWVECLDDN